MRRERVAGIIFVCIGVCIFAGGVVYALIARDIYLTSLVIGSSIILTGWALYSSGKVRPERSTPIDPVTGETGHLEDSDKD